VIVMKFRFTIRCVFRSTLRLCLVGLIWGDLLFKKMDLRGWRLFGWPDLEGWMRRDLQDWNFAHLKRFAGIWRDEKRNYEIALVNEVEITKYPWLWKLQNTPLSEFRVCNNIYYIWKINWFIPNSSNNWFQWLYIFFSFIILSFFPKQL